jgi:hypothetical protein
MLPKSACVTEFWITSRGMRLYCSIPKFAAVELCWNDWVLKMADGPFAEWFAVYQAR